MHVCPPAAGELSRRAGRLAAAAWPARSSHALAAPPQRQWHRHGCGRTAACGAGGSGAGQPPGVLCAAAPRAWLLQQPQPTCRAHQQQQQRQQLQLGRGFSGGGAHTLQGMRHPLAPSSVAAAAHMGGDRATAPDTAAERVHTSRSVAVIGAGAAGLVAARELLREGHSVTVFEQSGSVGGVWAYDPAVEDDDMLGSSPGRARVHSSMYSNLRTNLPREIMGYSDFPFMPATLGAARCRDARRYCSHTEVAAYLEAFAEYYDLSRHVRFHTRVTRVIPMGAATSGLGDATAPAAERAEGADGASERSEGAEAAAAGAASCASQVQRWQIVWERVKPNAGGKLVEAAGQQSAQAEFDAVVVCNGHYSEPKLPDVRGMDSFPGAQMHSHNYREPSAFRDQVVLVVGASNSGNDISREISGVASRVLVAARNWPPDAGVGKGSRPYGEHANIYRYPMVSELTADGAAAFPGGERVPCVDAVVYCTGYRYTFPFLLEADGSEHDPAAGTDPDGTRGRGHSSRAGGAGGDSNDGGGRGDGSLPGERPEPPQVLLPRVQAVPCTGASTPPHSTLRVEQQRVGPLYQHLFPPALAPHLSFLGLPWKVVPFPQQELQAKLVARCLSGRARLPSVDAMKDHTERFYRRLDEQGTPVRYTHMQNAEQWAYNDELARMCGDDVPPTTAWRMQMYRESSLSKRILPETYRDGPFTPEDEQAIMWAHEELEAQAARLAAERPGWLAADPSPLAGSQL